MRHLLATRYGRLLTFFLLYVTEGIPQGFASVAIAFQMRKQGLGPAEVGAFVASLYLPWAWKVFAGPVVDLVYSERLGKRRAWIVGCQLMMSLTLLAAWPIDYSTNLHLFSLIIVVHNVFAATQDVAIDALAVTVLPESERGTANGFMFAGAYTGAGIGGAGVLYLTSVIGFSNSFWLVAGSILLVTVFISLRIREPRTAVAVPQAVVLQPIAIREDGRGATIPLEYGRGNDLPEMTAEKLRPADVLPYLGKLFKSMFGNARALAAFFFALLPTGAFAVSLTVSQNLSAEFGLSEATVANITVVSTILSVGGCLSGGFLSDRIGRRKAISLFAILTLIPTLALAWHLNANGWIMPIDTKAASRPVPADGLVTAFIVWGFIYSYVIGLIYGSRTAGFMDVSNPVVAATQFTAYMSLMNLAMAYSSWWQGWAIEHWGYPNMLITDAALGLICLVPLALMAPRKPIPALETTPMQPDVQHPAQPTGSP
ncbi:MFS transporter [Humisphaera borealis]|uniref:MFS transporter n=1 Tax=Humisphaera borealis TaxID=2807512 RepID=A0A7M2X233_9BACT|nr:MFS transporter [Humisphaera borealis]QOV91798.1 MFS transporter [Humisphaera borealis]